jgi:Na+/H+-dicarboxylate symporter
VPEKTSILSNYRFLITVLAGIAIGCILGVFLGKQATVLKPIGDLFLNLLFTLVIPLVFVSIASAVASVASLSRLGRILGAMIMVFVLTGAAASAMMLIATQLFPPARNVQIELKKPAETEKMLTPGEQLVRTFTVSDFPDILSRKNMLPLIIFAMIFGLAVVLSGEAGRQTAELLASLSEVMMKLISMVMIIAPIGLGAYFAYLTGVFGPALLGSYARAMLVYYPVAILYFFLAYTLYTWLAAGAGGVPRFWREIITPAVTALGTGSSVATIPANLVASERLGVPRDIREIVIPVGATIHMDGSCLSAVLKIAFLTAVFGVPFHGLQAYATAIGVAILSGTVMAGIPGGGFVGELLIATLYGFPPEALPILAVLGTLVDPPATMVNSTGDTVSGMLIARILDGKKWMQQSEETTLV